MDNYTIFTKTAKGLGEALGKTKNLSREARKILKEIDGKTPFYDLRERLDMDEDKLQAALAKMLGDDYIREFGSAAPALAATASVSMGDTEFGLTSPAKLDNALTQLTIGDFMRAMEAPPAEGGNLDFKSLLQSSEETDAAAQQAKMEQAQRQEQAQIQAQKQAEEEARKAAEVQARKVAQEAARKQAEEAARQAAAKEQEKKEAQALARRQAEEKAKQEAAARAKQEAEKKAAEEQARRAAEEAARKAAAEQAKRAAEEKAQQEAQARAKAEAEAKDKARRQEEEAARRKAAELALFEEAERLRQQAQERARQEAEEQARKQAEEAAAQEAARRQAEEQAKAEAAERARQEAEEQARLEAEAARARQEAEEKARREAEELAKKQAEEQAQKQAEEQARLEAQARAKKEAEEQTRQKAWAAARKAAEELAAREAQQKAKQEALEKERLRLEEEARLAAEHAARLVAEQQARREAEEQVKREVIERARQEAEEQARLRAEQAARLAAEEQARKEAEELARIQAEEDARIQAAEQAQREAEEQTRRQAKEQAKREAEEKARLQAEEKARIKAEQQAIKEAEARARQEAKEQAKREAEQQARLKAEEKARIKAEKEAEKEAARQAKRDAKELPAISGGKHYAGAPLKLLRIGVLGMVIVAVLAVGLIHLISFDSRIPMLEQAAAEQLGQPVKIRQLRLSLLPRPHWRMMEVAIGREGEIVAAQIDANADLANLLSDKMVFASIELQAPIISDAGLGWLLFGTAKPLNFEIGRISATNARVLSEQIRLPTFDVEIVMDERGGWKKMVLEAEEKNLHVTLQPKDGKVQLEVSADRFKPPFGAELVLEKFTASGTAHRNGVDIDVFDGGLLDGRIGGAAQIRWGGGWTLSGELTARQIDPALLAPKVLQGGRLEGSMRYALQAEDAGKLFAAPRARGNFTIANGSVEGVDLASLLIGQSRSGKSGFTSLSGEYLFEGGKTQLRRINLGAGLLSASGLADVDAGEQLSGRFVVELKTPTRQSRANLDLSGTLGAPKFGQ